MTRPALWLTMAVLAWPAGASASGGAVVPSSAAEGTLRGLPAMPPARFANSGSTLAQAGDVNGDGVADVAVAALCRRRPG
jgi:hypothetical protein